jgi:hypothetical protein
MGSGLIIGGQRVPVQGIDVTNFFDNPRLKLASGDVRLRASWERDWVHLIVMHTTGGIPGGTDLRPQLIKPGLGQSSNAGARIVSSWTNDPTRPGGAHLIVDYDGLSYCCADLLQEAAYHAQRANGISVGIEVVQYHADAGLFEGQLAAAARLAVAVATLMPIPIQLQIPTAYTGNPLKRFLASQMLAKPLRDVVGIVGHRDLTNTRGAGDPGDALMTALEVAGCERFDFEAGADFVAWRERQSGLGISPADGIPGPRTVEALRKMGYSDGLWRTRAS